MRITVHHIAYNFVLLIVLGFTIYFFRSNAIEKSDYQAKPDISAIRTSILYEHAEMQNEIKHINSIISDKNRLKKYFFIRSSNLFEESKVGYFIYKNNELVYWTTNDIPLPTSTTPFFFHDKVINLNNGWYSVESIFKDDYHIVGLLQIKQEYSYNNELLQTGFNPSLNIDKNYDIVSDSVENAIPVVLGQEMGDRFYLLPVDIPYYELKRENVCIKIVVIWLLIFVFTLLFVYLLYSYLTNLLPKYHNSLTLSFIIFIVGARYYLILKNLPNCLLEYKIFSPELFAQSEWLPSLGDYMINAVILLYISLVYIRNLKINPRIKTGQFSNWIFSASISLIIIYYVSLVLKLSNGLVWNSSISFNFNNILDLDIYSFIGLTIIMLIMISCLLIFDKIITIFKDIISIKVFISIFFVILFISNLYIFNVDEVISTLVILVTVFFIILIISYLRLMQKTINYYWTLIILILASALISERFITLSEQKQKDVARVLAYNLATERDIGAEFFISELDKEIKQDENIQKIIENFDYDKIQNYVNNKILSNRYLSKYDYLTTICRSTDSLLIEPDNISKKCFDFFNNLKQTYGIELPNTNFYYLDNHNGRISYFGYYSYYNQDSIEIRFFIELNSKLFSEGLGYPELLLEKRLKSNESLREYNYAKYHKQKLVTSKGGFNYPVSIKDHLFNHQDEFILYEGFMHFIYKQDEDNIIILSKEEDVYTKELVSFSYVFALLFIVFNILWFLFNVKYIFKNMIFTLKAKIQTSFISILILSLIVTATMSIFFIVRGYQDKQNEFLEDKVKSILTELENEFVGNSKFSVEDISYLNYLLVEMSNVYYTDINLYDTEGRLFATSRRELYNHGLKGRYLDTKAYRKLIIGNSGSVIINEEIGHVNYLSAYIPFRNIDNEIIAYLNLPYFARQNEFREEISGFIVAFSNIFIILVLFSVIIGVVISKQVTKPLSLIQEKIRLMDISKKAVKIKYNKNDELGGLVREYNRKLDELTESVNKLAQSEREMAWREMAKQIAHEIKNPLTPMKLSVQYLEHSYNPQDEKWEKTFKRVCKTLVEQIDVLSNIATEFSNFAKMPISHKNQNNLVEIINNTVQLFKSIENVKFITSINIKGKGIVNADREQITRVFNNLIKNSIQSIPDERSGIITIKVEEERGKYIISLKDNGKGIDKNMVPKIFQPNFTTKSGGMGLGLSMVKNIIDSNDGHISFETFENQGTEFIIELPKVE